MSVNPMTMNAVTISCRNTIGEQHAEDAFGGKQERRRGGRHVRKTDVLQREREAGCEQRQVENAAQQFGIAEGRGIEGPVNRECYGASEDSRHYELHDGKGRSGRVLRKALP